MRCEFEHRLEGPCFLAQPHQKLRHSRALALLAREHEFGTLHHGVGGAFDLLGLAVELDGGGLGRLRSLVGCLAEHLALRFQSLAGRAQFVGRILDHRLELRSAAGKRFRGARAGGVQIAAGGLDRAAQLGASLRQDVGQARGRVLHLVAGELDHHLEFGGAHGERVARAHACVAQLARRFVHPAPKLARARDEGVGGFVGGALQLFADVADQCPELAGPLAQHLGRTRGGITEDDGHRLDAGPLFLKPLRDGVGLDPGARARVFELRHAVFERRLQRAQAAEGPVEAGVQRVEFATHGPSDALRTHDGAVVDGAHAFGGSDETVRGLGHRRGARKRIGRRHEQGGRQEGDQRGKGDDVRAEHAQTLGTEIAPNVGAGRADPERRQRGRKNEARRRQALAGVLGPWRFLFGAAQIRWGEGDGLGPFGSRRHPQQIPKLSHGDARRRRPRGARDESQIASARLRREWH